MSNTQLKSEYSDVMNRPLNVGDYITYAAGEGRSSVLRVGKITALTQAKKDKWYHTEDKTQLKIKCLSVDIEFGGKPRLMDKQISLGFFHRLCKVDYVEPAIKELLDSIRL